MGKKIWIQEKVTKGVKPRYFRGELESASPKMSKVLWLENRHGMMDRPGTSRVSNDRITERVDLPEFLP